jgi:hypothetical protein
MRRFILLAGLVVCAGCGGEGDAKDEAAVFEAVIKAELKGTKDGDGYYVFVNGVDPEAELLKKLQKQFRELQPGSKAPQHQGNRVSVSELKWINRNTAELRGGFSNGKDGRGSEYRVGRQNNEWVVISSKVTVQS